MGGRSTAAVIALAFLAVGCRGGDAVAMGPTVRDSAGIQIVESEKEDPPAWRVDPRPVLRVGAVEGAPESLLDGVRGATRLPDGGVVVADGGTGQLRWYDARGGHVRSAGGDGGGPGEFLTLTDFVLGDDGRVHVWDATALRLSTFSPDGRFADDWTVRGDSLGVDVRLAGVLDDGSIVLADGASPIFRVSPRATRAPLRLLRASPGAAVQPLMTLPGPERFTWGSTTAALRTDAPFPRATFIAARHGRVWVGDNERNQAGIYSPDGRLLRIVRRAGEPRRVSEAEREAFRRAWREGGGGQLGAADVERLLAEMPFPATHPAFTGMHVDAAGRLWLRETGGAESASRWAIFDAEGRLAGTVVVPERVELLDARDGHVVGRWTDDDGVEFVHVYRVTETEAER